jgi:hypothetical protein
VVDRPRAVIAGKGVLADDELAAGTAELLA